MSTGPDEPDRLDVPAPVDGTDAGAAPTGEEIWAPDAEPSPLEGRSESDDQQVDAGSDEDHHPQSDDPPAAATEGHQAGRRLVNATAIMASGTMVSRILGFARAILLAFVLGNGSRQVEMFGTATLIPNTLYMLFAGGALNTVLVPQIVRAIKNDADAGQAFVNRIMTAFLAALAVVAALMTLATPLALMLWTNSQWRTPALADHYASLTFLTYLTMPQIFFYGAFFLIGQVLNARDRFGPMMWAPIANNVIQILVLAGYVAVWGTAGSTAAPFTSGQMWLLGLGSTVGILVQTLILIPYLRQVGFHYKPRWDLKGTGLGRTFHVSKWMLGYTALTMAAQTVVWNLATSAVVDGTGAGGNVYQNAYLIWILPHSLLTVALATAMLPSASRMAAAGDLRGVEKETSRAVELASTFLLPGSLGLLVLADPIARLAFGHGRGADDAHFVAWTLMAFAIGLVPYTIQYLYLRGFYAMEETRIPFWIQVVISGLNALLALAFVLPWNDPATVAPRLALSYSLSYFVGCWLSHRWLKKALPTLSGAPLMEHLRRVLYASVPAAVAAGLIAWAFSRFSSVLLQIIGLSLASLVAVLAFFFAAKRMKIDAANDLLQVLRRRGPSDTDEAPGKATAGLDAGEVAEPTDPGTPVGLLSQISPTRDALLAYPDPDDGHAALLEMPDDPQLPRVEAGQILVDRYRLDELLAVRGARLTWRAFDQRLSRSVLMHVLPVADERAGSLLDLARRAAGATDSRFLRVLDAGRASDHGPTDSDFGAYIVYEYAPGLSLETLLQSGPLTGLQAAWVIREVADAISGVHARGMFHERLNPDTVVLTATGNVKIVGLLVEAGLTDPEADIDPEDLDVFSLGKLLYACLVTRWPGGQRYGLKAAPADSGRLFTPGQVKQGVSRPLDALCDRILNPVPRNRASRVDSAQRIVRILNEVLGQASAAHDLERRLKMPIEQFRPAPLTSALTPTPARPAMLTSAVPVSQATPDDETADWLLPPDDPDEGEGTAPFTPVPPPPPKANAPATPPGIPLGLTPQRPRWLMIAALSLFCLLLAGAIVWVATSQVLSRPAPTAVTSSAPAVVKIVSVEDFDPVADGGSGRENARLAKRAIDADPASSWTTERYRANPKLGGLKPGVGLVIDLGSAKPVSSVQVGLIGTGTTVELRVPVEDNPKAKPVRSQADWRVVATLDAATGKVTLTPAQPLTSRYLLVYLTSLPPEVGSYFQGGISTLEVR